MRAQRRAVPKITFTMQHNDCIMQSNVWHTHQQAKMQGAPQASKSSEQEEKDTIKIQSKSIKQDQNPRTKPFSLATKI